ncbi:hypothetical protein AB0O58_05675 [Rhodococcus sp. NPDC080181]|uniref:hypothetical protein n=1 Tax=Rhodococcus sp. NPDC080181 TaxID=3155292 RepID=UPI00344B47C0
MTTEIWQLSESELLADAADVSHQIQLLEARRIALVADIDTRVSREKLGFPGPAGWLTSTTLLTPTDLVGACPRPGCGGDHGFAGDVATLLGEVLRWCFGEGENQGGVVDGHDAGVDGVGDVGEVLQSAGEGNDLGGFAGTTSGTGPTADPPT